MVSPVLLPEAKESIPIIFAATCAWRKYLDPSALGALTSDRCHWWWGSSRGSLLPFDSRNGVISTFMERIAAEDALERQPAALEGAIFFNGLQGVLGAGGDIVAAAGPVGRNGPLLKPDQGFQNMLHGLSSSSSSFRQSFTKVSFSSCQETFTVRVRATRMMS